ncbi:MAG: hypothetical protein KGS48_02510, partial [Bacteroidetes bacterium]|nr:hypothetical protein [Bacteroidota bacterium]
EFLKTIDYVEAVERSETDSTELPDATEDAMVPEEYFPGEKPSDFAGIWKTRKKIDAKKLREKAWRRKGNSRLHE